MTEQPRIRILYMEDDAGLARLLKKQLDRAGFEVDIAPDGQQGLTMYQSAEYQVLLVDQTMPGMVGLDVLRHLADPGPLPPTVMLTGTGDEGIAVQAMHAGAADYVVKDSDGGYMELLPTKIQQVLDSKRLEEVHRRAEARYRDLFENAHDLILSVDLDGNFLYVNRQWLLVLGYSAEQAQTVNFFDTLRSQGAADLQALFERLRAGHMPASDELAYLETTFLTSDGQPLHVEGNVNVQETESGLVAVRGIFRDVTRRKQAEEELARLEALREELRETLVHDLRSPATTIKMALGVLAEEIERDDLQHLIQMLTKGAEEMLRLTDAYLDVSRLEAGQYILHPEAIALAPFVFETLDPWRAALELKSVVLDVTPVADDWQLVADYHLVKRVLGNLVSNALKFSRPQQTVNVSLVEENDGVTFSVSDEGRGIKLEDQERIFRKFTQLERLPGEKGSGVGLAFCKLAVEAHGGQITVESAPGEGTTFTFNIPHGLEPVA